MAAATFNSNSEIIKILKSSGADINMRDKDGWTPLMLAAQANNNLEVVETLL